MSRATKGQGSCFLLVKYNKTSVETKLHGCRVNINEIINLQTEFHGFRVNINEVINLQKVTFPDFRSIFICLVNFFSYVLI